LLARQSQLTPSCFLHNQNYVTASGQAQDRKSRSHKVGTSDRAPGDSWVLNRHIVHHPSRIPRLALIPETLVRAEYDNHAVVEVNDHVIPISRMTH
jgi:hypothetical protein